MSSQGARLNSKQERPDVFVYHDCRLYLVDLFSYLKETSSGFNVAQLAQRAKISKGYLSMVLKGKWKLTIPALRKMLPYLGLAKNEENFLELLCLLAKADTATEKAQILEQLHRIKGYKKNNPAETVIYHYFSRWYHLAIRELSALPDFELKPEWIQRRLREAVPLSDIEKAINFLIANGFLTVGTDGKVSPPDKRLECMDEVYKTAMIRFHEQVFRMAIDHVPKLDAGEKNLTAHMVALSLENFGKIKTLMDDTLKQIIDIASKEKNPQALFQFSLLGFSLSRVDEKDLHNE
jgi:uncharacterized protein (TIGR02147 family)